MSDLNRRTFLASAGAGAAALALGNPARAAGANDQIRVAVIGFRGRGKSHIDAFTSHKQTVVATLCDVDSRLFGPAAEAIEMKTHKKPEYVQDLRRVFDDKNIDVVSIATPNHWHALATVWACQAGKDVYVEKPVSHNFIEGGKMVEAARKYGRIVQTGTQNRSSESVAEAVEFMRSGGIGKVYMARALCFKPRGSIGHKVDGPVPAGVDYNLWLGPAPERPFNPNRFHYEWHWNWDYGNGDLGNQGIHQMDVARWGLGKDVWPTQITGSGGRYGYKDDGETPNTEICTYKYDDCELVFEVRGLPTNEEMGVKIGNLFYGTKGVLAINGNKWTTTTGASSKSEKARSNDSEAKSDAKSGTKSDAKSEIPPSDVMSTKGDHFANFIEAVLAHDPKKLRAEIVEGHRSSALCHLGNIAYRTGRTLTFDGKTETFPGDAQANALLGREYRSPFTMPDKV